MPQRSRPDDPQDATGPSPLLLFAESPRPMWVYDAETLMILDVNDAAVATYGWSHEEFLRMTVRDVRPPEDVAEFERALVRVGDRFHISGEWRHRRRDGSVLDVEITSHGLEYRGRRARLVLVTDITERRRVERALKASEARFRAVFDQAGIGIALVDSAGAIVRVNSAFAGFVGSTPEQLVGVASASLSPPEDAAITREALRRLREDGDASVTVEKRYVHPDGALRWGSLTVSAIETEERDAELILGLVQDITAQKASEATLEAREAHFRQAQKLEAVGRLAGGVAHDFNNILAAIASYAELLAGEIPAGSGMAEDLREIRLAAERGARLTRQLLSFSRQQPVRPQRLDVRAILREFEPFLRRLIGAEVGLVVQAPTPGDPSGHPIVLMDRGQLEQVVMNLVVNARDAMPDGGTITVTVGVRAIADAVDDADAWEASALPRALPGCYVQLGVRDTGVGMDETVRRRALEPFFSTKEGSGTGLGLSTVYGIVTQAGGALRIDSAPGAGTSVDVLLPLDPASTRPGVLSATPASSPGIGSAKGADHGTAEQRLRRLRPLALVVDDERPIAHAAARLLEGRGWNVEVTVAPEAALRTLATRGPEIGLLLTDVRMPDMSGHALAARCAELCPGAAIVLMSGFPTTGEGPSAPTTASSGPPLLAKPFDADALQHAIMTASDAVLAARENVGA